MLINLKTESKLSTILKVCLFSTLVIIRDLRSFYVKLNEL